MRGEQLRPAAGDGGLFRHEPVPIEDLLATLTQPFTDARLNNLAHCNVFCASCRFMQVTLGTTPRVVFGVAASLGRRTFSVMVVPVAAAAPAAGISRVDRPVLRINHDAVAAGVVDRLDLIDSPRPTARARRRTAAGR